MTNVISLGTAVAQWSASFVDGTPEVGLMMIWGGLLILIARPRREAPRSHDPKATALLDSVARPQPQAVRG